VSGPGIVGEHEEEPVPGLPERPPKGERILWQGSPSWRGLALRAFHARKVAVYFGLLLLWRVGAALSDGAGPLEAAAAGGMLVGLGLTAVGILCLLAWLNARATIYTITSRRVVMRFGVALSLALNLPFRQVQSAGLKRYSDGSVDIPLEVEGVESFGYLMLWPHARPWGFGVNARPMLRAVPEGEAVARILARALATSSDQAPRVVVDDTSRSAAPQGVAAAAS